MPELVLENLDGLDETRHGDYEERDGRYHLKLGGDVEAAGYVSASDHATLKASMRDMRENNRALNGQLADERERFKPYEGIDLDEYKAQATRVAELEEGNKKKPAEMEQAIERAVKAATSPLIERLDTSDARARDAEAKLTVEAMRTSLRKAANESGIAPEALDDFVARGERVFKVSDGKHLAENGDGVVRYSEDDPSKPLGMTEWARGLKPTAPHLFKRSSGGGSGGDGGAGASTGIKTTTDMSDKTFLANVEAIAQNKLQRVGNTEN